MPDDPHFIPPAERADGEPGEGGCLRAEAEEREAEQSAPDLLRHYRAIINPPPDQPYPSQALADMMARGEYPHGLRAPLKANFDQACRRGGWEAFGFPVDQGRRVRIRSPWREELRFEDNGVLVDGVRRTHVDVLFYRVGTEPPAEGGDRKQVAGTTPAHSDEGAAGAKKKTKPASVAAEMVAWFDGLPPKQRNKTPNALADLYLREPGRRGSKRYACKVFASPDKYRARSGV
jgi:hypothetical protein